MNTEYCVAWRQVFYVVRPNPTRFFELNPILDPKFGLSQVGLALRVKNISNRVGLASNRFQIWVQLYNVLNKPNFNPILGWVGLPESKFWLSWVGLVRFI